MKAAESLDLSKKLNNCRAIIIIGDTCVGKSYVGRHIVQELVTHSPFVFEYIEVSNIVKRLSKNPQKDGLDLLNSDDLMVSIVNEIETRKNVVLVGLREQKICDLIRRSCKKVSIVRVTAPAETIAKRIYQRKDVDSVKVERDKKYDYENISVDFELQNTREKSWVELFWDEDFRNTVGLIV